MKSVFPQKICQKALVAACLTILSSFLLPMSIQAQGQYRTIVKKGDSANGDGVHTRFTSFELNQIGEVAFMSRFISGASGGSASNEGVYLDSSGVLLEIAREGGSTSNGRFGSFNGLQLNNSGQVVFESRDMSVTNNGTADDRGVFFHNGTNLQEIARKGDNTGNGLFESLSNIRLNDTGQIVFRSDLTGTTGGTADDMGLFFFNGSNLPEIAREGDATSNGNFGSYFGSVHLNQSGHVGFNSIGMTGTSGGTADDEGLFLFNGSTIQEIARKGDATTNGNFGILSLSDMNDSGQLAFASLGMSGTTGGSADNHALFLYDGNNIQELARIGDATSNGSFSNFVYTDLNNVGQLAFRSDLTGTAGGFDDSVGIFFYDGSTIGEIARKGDATADGNFGDLREVHLNDAGQIAFISGVMTGTSAGTANDTAAFVSDGIDTIEIRRKGDMVGGLTVEGIHNIHLNELGQVAIHNALFFGNTDESIELFTPDLHWRSPSSGNWDDRSNWTLSIDPAIVHDVFIDPDTNLTIQGPGRNVGARNFQLGGGPGAPTLNWDQAFKLSASSISILDGTLTGGGIFNSDSVFVATDGSIVVQNNSMEFNATTFDNQGLVHTDSSTLRVNGDLTNSGQIDVVSNGALVVTGDLVQNGSLFVDASMTTVQGKYSGDGDFTGNGALNIDGILSPGNSTASILLDGVVNLGSDAVSEFELGGVSFGEFDQIHGMDEFTIDGDLLVTLTGGFELNGGMRFIIADVEGSAFGTFDGLADGALVGNFGGQDLFIGYGRGDGNDVALFTSVPEPNALILVGMAGLAMLNIRRRRRKSL